MPIQVVGRRRELELVRAALASGAHILIEGPPGTGKSTLLRQVAESRHTEFVLVEGSAELTPARLIGSFDPALVLEQGYRTENFSDGPLVRAMRAVTTLPLAVGFGVSNADQARTIGELADGVAVGSAFVRTIEENAGCAELETKLETLARELSGGLLSKNR